MKLDLSIFDECRVYRISGSIGWEDARLLDLELQRGFQAGLSRVIVHLESIRHLSSYMIGVLLGHARESQQFHIVTSDAYVVNLMEECGLSQVLQGRLHLDLESLHNQIGHSVAPDQPRNRCCVDTWNLQVN